MIKIKKVISLILCAVFLLSFTACKKSTVNDKLEQNKDSLNSWLIDGVSADFENLISKYSGKAEEQGLSAQFKTVTTPFNQTNLSMFAAVFEKASETDVTNKFTYSAEDYNQTMDLYYDAENKKTALETDYDDGNIVLTEVRYVKKDTVAMQNYSTTEDGRYNLIKILFSGTDGEISYSYDLSVRPTRLYAQSEVGDDFASSGDETFVLKKGELTFSSNRTKVQNASEFESWFDGFKNGIDAYYERNVSKAEEMGKKDLFGEYLLCFEQFDIKNPVNKALKEGKFENGMYIYNSNGENIVVSYDGSTANIQLRYTKASENYCFELREIGKREFSMQFYHRTENSTYNVYRTVLRLEGDMRTGSCKDLKNKPDLVYSKPDDALGMSWIETYTDNYFSVINQEMIFTDNIAKRETA